MPNIGTKRRNMTQPLFDYLERTSPYRERSFYRKNNTHRIQNVRPMDDDAWIRPKIVHAPSPNRTIYDRNVYIRQTQSSTPGGFNLLDWLTCLVNDIFNDNFSQRLDMFFADLKAWFENDNISPSDYPDVGFLYWATFWFRCEWPESLNCSIGIGLRDAIGKVFVVSFFVFFVGALIFPTFLLPLTGVGAFLFYVIVLPTVAWHYSPQVSGYIAPLSLRSKLTPIFLVLAHDSILSSWWGYQCSYLAYSDCIPCSASMCHG